MKSRFLFLLLNGIVLEVQNAVGVGAVLMLTQKPTNIPEFAVSIFGARTMNDPVVIIGNLERLID